MAVNTFGFVSPAIATARVAVVHDGGASQVDAQRIVAGMPSSVRRTQITATAIPVSAIGSSGANVFFLASGMSNGSLSSVRSQLAGRQDLCVTTERRYVENGACILAVSSSPQVRIVVNNSAARQFGVRFATALMMMVEEI
ncbi:MAG: YfiR/HmsC family protein [Pseudomonadota bacterium]